MDDWKLPGILPDNMQDYETGEWAQIAQWIESLHGTSGRVYRWTWYQLFLDCIIYIFREVARGIISRAKLGDLQKRDPPRNRTKCVRWFNSFFFNNGEEVIEKPLPVKHMRADSSVLAFWSNTLTPKIRAVFPIRGAWLVVAEGIVPEGKPQGSQKHQA